MKDEVIHGCDFEIRICQHSRVNERQMLLCSLLKLTCLKLLDHDMQLVAQSKLQADILMFRFLYAF